MSKASRNVAFDVRIVPETFQEAVVRTALQVVRRRLEDIDCQLEGDCDEAKQVDFTVGRREWEVLAAADFEKPAENVACEDVLKTSSIATFRTIFFCIFLL